MEVLAEKADEINWLLRESGIKDEFRPAHVAAIMLALWQTRGDIRRDQRHVLQDVNAGGRDAFIRAGKADLAKSIRVEEANNKLRTHASRIVTILERLNVTVLTAEHDYLGQLYETFFRYIGGNTIGQYFTPRHIARMMVDSCAADSSDTVLDIACGSGGFFVTYMDLLVNVEYLSRSEMVSVIQERIIGFESEPVTAALCAANMILRGDGSNRIHQADSLSLVDFPVEEATLALMNPPFPHKKTDTPVEAFVEQGLEGLCVGGKRAVIVPSSLLSKASKEKWRNRILEQNSLLAVCQLPDELFEPFASVTTAMILLEKGRKHRSSRKTVFARLQNDGLILQRKARVARKSKPNQTPDVIEAVENKQNVPGFYTAVGIADHMGWSVGAYIRSSSNEDDLCEAVDVHLRRMASFYTKYAPEIVTQRRAIDAGEIENHPYRELMTSIRLANANKLLSEIGTIGATFDILLWNEGIAFA